MRPNPCELETLEKSHLRVTCSIPDEKTNNTATLLFFCLFENLNLKSDLTCIALSSQHASTPRLSGCRTSTRYSVAFCISDIWLHEVYQRECSLVLLLCFSCKVMLSLFVTSPFLVHKVKEILTLLTLLISLAYSKCL